VDKIPKECPVKEILKQLGAVLELNATVLELHHEVLVHCDKCVQGDAPST